MWGMVEGALLYVAHYVIILNGPTRGAFVAKLEPSQHHSSQRYDVNVSFNHTRKARTDSCLTVLIPK